MAVTYMLALEEEPDSYEKLFTQLTKGNNKQIQDWILKKTHGKLRILEIGCGPGTLAIRLAKEGHIVHAIDQNIKMIEYAKSLLQQEKNLNLTFYHAKAQEIPDTLGKFDIIITTFMLSELRIFEQQIFLQQVWQHLEDNGKLLLAEEFIPTGIHKISFFLKRWWYKLMLHRKKKGETHPLQYFLRYLSSFGFLIKDHTSWNHQSIRVFEIEKTQNTHFQYYLPTPRRFKGFNVWLRLIYQFYFSQKEHMPIEPGIYKSGNPINTSPVIVTANYEYTFVKVMRDLDGLDAWVLCIDSSGINVWCAARGNEFGNRQLLEATKATGLDQIISHRELLLPQLSAGGISVPELKKEKFPFNIKFGPVWSKDIKKYLELKPQLKPESMRLAKFTLSKRLEVGTGHAAFLIRKFIFWPSLVILLLLGIFQLSNVFLSYPIFSTSLTIIGYSWFSIIFINILMSVIFPIVEFTQFFIKKGIILGIILASILSLIFYMIIGNSWYIFPLFMIFLWITFFSTMSFSGSTMASSPRIIQHEYPMFAKLNYILFFISLFFLIIILIGDIIKWI